MFDPMQDVMHYGWANKTWRNQASWAIIPALFLRTAITAIADEENPMKTRLCLLVVFCLALGLAACGGSKSGPGGASGPGTIAMHYTKLNSGEKVDKEFAIKSAFATTSWINVPGSTTSEKVTRYYITLSDFDYDPQTSSSKPKVEGQATVEIDFFADKGAPVETPIKTGSYEFANRGVMPWNSYGKINNIIAYTFIGGKNDEYSLAYNAKGTVKIDSVSADAVSGELDLTQDNGGTIKGSFTAKPFKLK